MIVTDTDLYLNLNKTNQMEFHLLTVTLKESLIVVNGNYNCRVFGK